ncbi:helix-turn-helix domain-containing protein [Alkalihalobacillus trypoxylicola]|uniref:HTH cro/C1-type domain-containing protein n=2 Tax=Alkalihalobacillus trypoxylicola TaxID=519424 RepID=A0A161P7A9_9BACI|nr:helix-turn-helix domain-containing protein [Alkalihalobacillus trypoxylicola]KYG26961.1 hypothetical protein AZF04_11505 [Alkalihalobacillus trypoxylicola]
MDRHIGKKLQELRHYYNVSQKDLAEGICNQSNIAHIENGGNIPNAEILFKLAKKLGVTINYFFDDYEAPRSNYVQDTCELIRQGIREYKFKETLQIIKKEYKNPLFKKVELKKFLLWQQSICHFYLQNTEEALELIDIAYQIEITARTSVTSLNIEILTSKAVMLTDLDRWMEATELYEKAIELFNKHPMRIDFKILSRLYYNSSANFYKAKDYKKSIHNILKGINYSIKHESMYLLGEMYYQAGLTYIEMKEPQEALYSLEKSIYIFKLKESPLLNYAENKYKQFLKGESLLEINTFSKWKEIH